MYFNHMLTHSLVNRLFKPAQEKVWLGTDRPAMTIAVDLGRKATKQTNKDTFPLDRHLAYIH